MIQITRDPSAERTAPPRSTHVRCSDVSHALIQQEERERLRKTRSSSSTTAWWLWRSVAIQQGFAKHHERQGEREVGLRQGEVETLVYGSPRTSSIYRGEGGGAPPLGFPPQGVRQPQTHLGWRPRGERGNLPPKQGGGAPSPNPRRLGPLWGGVHQPTWGWSPPTLGPCSPPGLVAPLGGPPGPS